MIEFAKITGMVQEDLVEVKLLDGVCVYAPVIAGISSSAPSKNWIGENKDKFLALVAFEGGDFSDPFIVGFYPIKSSDSSKYNINERILAMLIKLVGQLIDSKVNTSIGPQPFMPDTIQTFNDIKDELNNVKDLILPIDKK